MGQGTQIAWTGTSRADGTVENDGHTFNPWIGCQKVSPACESCYAEVSTATRSTSARIGLKLWGPPKTATRYRTSAGNWREPFKWITALTRRSGPRSTACSSSRSEGGQGHSGAGARHAAGDGVRRWDR